MVVGRSGGYYHTRHWVKSQHTGTTALNMKKSEHQLEFVALTLASSQNAIVQPCEVYLGYHDSLVEDVCSGPV